MKGGEKTGLDGVHDPRRGEGAVNEVYVEGAGGDQGECNGPPNRGPRPPTHLPTELVGALYGLHGVDDEASEKIIVRADDLGGHRGLCAVDEHLLAQCVGLDGHVLVNELARLREWEGGREGGGFRREEGDWGEASLECDIAHMGQAECRQSV